MSTMVDQRVVEMRFDNRQFESNVSTTMSTLDKLKQSLNLTGAAKGLENVGTAAKSIDLAPLGTAAETVTTKFSHMQMTIQHQLNRIVDSAVSAGKRIVSALTIDPIKTGFAEYETQINAVQTILANTQSKGTTIGDVNKALDELNKYADMTIYNFTEMTRNIGTFTAAGVDLDKSVSSIKGIANLAAVSGSTSQQASTAMYQLSQALASGTVKLQDWNSVVNAGMGGQVFQDALKRTATHYGHDVDKMIEKYGSFRESLTKGNWLTAEVLTETLTQLSGAYTGADLIAQGYTEAQAKEITALADTAVQAATKVKTFTQLWDTLKEAAQSGWTQTWEILIGDFEEAKEMLSKVSDVLGEMINASAESRNTLLEGAMTSNWDKLIGKINEAGVETTKFESALRDTIKSHNIDVDAIIKQHGSLENAFRNGALSSDILREALNKLSSGYGELSSVQRTLKIGAAGDDVKAVQESLKELGYELGKFGADGKYGKITKSAVEAFQKANNLEVTGIVDDKTLSALREAEGRAKGLSDACDDLITNITNLGGRDNIIKGFANIFKGLLNIAKPIKEAFRNIFPPVTVEQVLNLTEGFRDLTERFREFTEANGDKIRTTFEGIFSVVDIGWTFVKDLAGGIGELIGRLSGLGGTVLDSTAAFGGWLINLRDTVKETDYFGIVIDKIVGFLSNIIDKIKEFGVSAKNYFKTDNFEGFLGFFQGLWDIIKRIGSKIGDIFEPLVEGIRNVFTSSNFYDLVDSGLLAGILAGVLSFSDKLTGPLEGITDVLSGIAGEHGLFKDVPGILDEIKGCFEAYQNSLNAEVLKKIAIAIGILAASIFVISSIDGEALDRSLGAITIMFGELIASLAVFSSLPLKLRGVTKAVGLMIGMGIAIAILAGAMKTLSTIDSDAVIRGLFTIGMMMGELAIMVKALSGSGKTGGLMSIGFSLILIGAAMKIFASAVSDFGEIDANKAIGGILSIGAMLAILGTFTKFTSGSSGMVSIGISLMLVAAAMKIFASVVSELGSMNVDQLINGLFGMGIALAGVAVALRYLPADSLARGAGLAVAAAGIAIIAKAFSSFGNMGWDQISKGIVAMGFALVSIAVALEYMNGALPGAAALIVAAGALAIITPILMALGSMSVGSIVKSLAALAATLAIFGVAAYVLAPVAGVLVAVAGAIALFGISIFAIGAGLVLIGAGITAIATSLAAGSTAIVAGLAAIIGGLIDLIPTIILGLGDAILAICTVIKECAPAIVETIFVLLDEVCSTLATYVPTIANSLFDLLIGALDVLAERMPELISAAVNVISSFFTGIVDALSGMDTSGLLKGIIGFALVTALTYALSGVAALIPGAMVGVLGLGVLIAEIALVLAAIGALAQIPGLEWLIGEGGDLLQQIGTAIGQFVGGIIGGVAEGATSTLPQIATNLSDFMVELQPFIDGASTIDASMMEGIKALADALLVLTGAGLLDAITSWLTGGSSLTKFAADLVPFGTAMRNYANEVAGIDNAAIANSVAAAQSLVAVAQAIPGDGLFGFDGIDDFGKNVVTFGESMKAYGDAVSGIDSAAISGSVTAAAGLVQVAKKIPDDGTFGTDGIDDFGKNILSFGKSLKKYGDNVSEVDTTAINNSITAIKKLIKLIDSMASIDASGVSTFKTAINNLSKTNVEGFADTFSKLSGELVSKGAELVESLSSGIESKKNVLTSTASNISETIVKAIDKCKDDFLKTGTESVSQFASGIANAQAKAMVAAVNMTSVAAVWARTSYSSFYSAGAYLVKGFANGISENTYIAQARARAMAAAAARAAKSELDEHSPSRVGYEIGDFFGQGFVNGIAEYIQTAYAVSKTMAGSAKSGLGDSIGNISKAFDGVVNENPVIRPVLDLSDIESGAGAINKLLNAGTSPRLLTSVGSISASMNRRVQNGSNDDVISAIKALGSKLGNTGDTYNINGISASGDHEVENAIKVLVAAAQRERRR